MLDEVTLTLDADRLPYGATCGGTLARGRFVVDARVFLQRTVVFGGETVISEPASEGLSVAAPQRRFELQLPNELPSTKTPLVEISYVVVVEIDGTPLSSRPLVVEPTWQQDELKTVHAKPVGVLSRLKRNSLGAEMSLSVRGDPGVPLKVAWRIAPERPALVRAATLCLERKSPQAEWVPLLSQPLLERARRLGKGELAEGDARLELPRALEPSLTLPFSALAYQVRLTAESEGERFEAIAPLVVGVSSKSQIVRAKVEEKDEPASGYSPYG